MRNPMKAVLIKPRFCTKVFIVKDEGPRDFVRYNKEFVQNHVR